MKNEESEPRTTTVIQTFCIHDGKYTYYVLVGTCGVAVEMVTSK